MKNFSENIFSCHCERPNSRDGGVCVTDGWILGASQSQSSCNMNEITTSLTTFAPRNDKKEILKCFFLLLILIICALPSFALKYEDVTEPREHAYRTGLSEQPEREYTEAKANNPLHQEYVKKDVHQFSSNDLTYADLSIKQISREVSADLELDQDDLIGDLSLLWQGAATQSDTKICKKSFDPNCRHVNPYRCRHGKSDCGGRIFNRRKRLGHNVAGHKGAELQIYKGQ